MSNERITQARELLAQFPQNDLARFNLAQACFETQDYAAAAEQLRVLCAHKADWMVAFILLGKCLLATGQSAAGKQAIEQAHQLAVRQHHDGPREELEELLKTLEPRG